MSGQPRPAWRLFLNGSTIPIGQRLLSLTLTDKRGIEADQLDIALDDSDGRLDLPRRGVVVGVQLGWEGEPLVDKGKFTVDEVEHTGAPDILTLRARSADLRAGLSQKKEQSFHDKTFGDLVKHIAAQHGLTPVIGAGLAAEKLEHVDQTGESDANLLTRMGQMLDAIVTVKAGRLLVFKPGQAVSVTGKPLPEITIIRTSGDSHRFNISDRENYTETEATWTDKKKGDKGSVIVQASGKGPKVATPSTGSKRVLRHVYANKKNAERAAKAAMNKTERAAAEFSITLAYGRPELFPEIPCTVRGFKPWIDSAKWVLTKVTHSIAGDGGYTMPLELELKL